MINNQPLIDICTSDIKKDFNFIQLTELIHFFEVEGKYDYLILLGLNLYFTNIVQFINTVKEIQQLFNLENTQSEEIIYGNLADASFFIARDNRNNLSNIYLIHENPLTITQQVAIETKLHSSLQIKTSNLVKLFIV
jgi:hypothetical protein